MPVGCWTAGAAVPDVEGFDVSVGKTIIVSVGCSATCGAGVPEPPAGVSVDCGAAEQLAGQEPGEVRLAKQVWAWEALSRTHRQRAG